MKIIEICNMIRNMLIDIHQNIIFKTGEELKRYIEVMGENIFVLNDFCYDEKEHKMRYEFLVDSEDEGISYERFEI